MASDTQPNDLLDFKPSAADASPPTKGSTIVWVVTGVIVLLVVVLWAIPAYQGNLHQRRMSEAIQDGFREEIKAAIVAARTNPASAAGRSTEFAPQSKFVKSINVDYRLGSVLIALDAKEFNRPDAIQYGSWVSYTAVVEDGKVTGWKCDKKDVAAKMLPALCR